MKKYIRPLGTALVLGGAEAEALLRQPTPSPLTTA